MAPSPPVVTASVGAHDIHDMHGDMRATILVAAPITVLVVFLAFCIWGPARKPDVEGKEQPRRALARRVVIRTLIGLFVAQGLVVGLTTPAQDASRPIVFVAGLVMIWSGVMLLLTLCSDLMLWSMALATAAFDASLVVLRPASEEPLLEDGVAVAKLSLQAARLALLLYLVVDSSLGLGASRKTTVAGTDTESEPLLLPNGETNGTAAATATSSSATANGNGAAASSSSSITAATTTPNYGGTTSTADDSTKAKDGEDDADKKKKDGDGDDDDEDKEDPVEARLKKRREDRLKQAGGWINYLKDFSIFLPIIDPRQEPFVIVCLCGVGLCIVATRFLVVMAPRQIGLVTDKLLAGEAPYHELAVWLLLSWISSYSGIGLIQSLVKLPIHMFSGRQLTNAAFRQVMSLSMDFHSDRDSGEIIRAIEQGRSITNVLEWMVTDIAPAMVDLTVAMVLLHHKFNIYVPLAMIASAMTFFWLELWTANNNRANRRQSTKLDREATRKMHQAVQNWPTVAYFNMFGYEGDRYATAIRDRQDASKRWWVRDAFNDAVVQGVVPLTFFVLASLAINEIIHGRSTTGDFVFLVQYWDYLVWPLRSLSWQAKYLMQDLTDAERLLELFQTKPSIAEKAGAPALPRAKGHVCFTDVGFSYDPRKTALTGINIDAQPGQTIAFVGATGAGKSSIIKLLHRFYDVTAGSITIDGHDIRDVTLGSLRDSLGVVPQDPMLFNMTIMENLRYAKTEATEDEVHAACRAAAIHDKIMTFADKYETKVGENGVKLSGGEAQRVAIARAFLKNPPILILDEATSAVDTNTEAHIQEALEELKRQRTTFVIAHRLSTIMDADVIMVIDEGKIVERGSHEELLKRDDGKYKGLWEMQAKGAKKKKKEGEGEGEGEVTVEDLIEMDKGEDKKDDKDKTDKTDKGDDKKDDARKAA